MQEYHSYNHDPEQYRGSPVQHNSNSNATLLPPIQHFEGANMQSQPQFSPVPMNGAQMQQHPPPYNPTQFQYPNGHMQPAPMPSNAPPAQNGMIRYAIPPQQQPGAHMSGGRHKKDIKRRTKTGCLTCRKRRIKCDEGHPTCRNCQKSKRECLGYDPIFKQQTGPAPIQPAPPNSSTPNSKPPPTSSIPPHSYQPQTYPAAGSAFVPTHNSHQSLDTSFEYSTSLDPALAGGDHPLTMASNTYSTTLQSTRKPKSISIDQLFSLNDVPPRYHERDMQPPDPSTNQQPVDDFYRFHFAPGLDKLFETNWYSTRGLTHLRQDPKLLDYILQCEEQFKTLDAATIQSLEARLVWQLAIMPRSASMSNGPNGQAPDQHDLLQRIDIIQHLITGNYLPQSKVPSPPSQIYGNLKHNEQLFWHQLGKFCSIEDVNPEIPAHQQINDCLNAMRGVLGMMENRDVLYSLAIVRYIGGRLNEFHPKQPLPTTTNDPNDEINKLEIARRFVENEDARGTTQVIQRICGMAMRGWILQKQ